MISEFENAIEHREMASRQIQKLNISKLNGEEQETLNYIGEINDFWLDYDKESIDEATLVLEEI